jgi:radical SAM protein with 4Fe4S-binding SPASM domain
MAMPSRKIQEDIMSTTTKPVLLKNDVELGSCPERLGIEITNHCNLDCVMCPRGIMQREVGYMNGELFRRIIDEAAAIGVKKITLHGLGEPLLHSELFDFIKYSKDAGILFVLFSTNCSFLDEEKAYKIFSSGLDEIVLSLDGVNAETYAAVRRKGDFKKVVKNITRFLEIRRELKSTNPRVTLQMIKLYETLDEIEEYRALWEDKVDNLNIKNFDTFAGQINNGPVIEYNQKHPARLCKTFVRNMLILQDGRVPLCTRDTNGAKIMGNLEKDTIKNIWNNSIFNTVRCKQKAGEYSSLPLCKGCPEWDL